MVGCPGLFGLLPLLDYNRDILHDQTEKYLCTAIAK